MSGSRSHSSTASYSQPIAGPNAAPHARIFPSRCSSRSVSQTRGIAHVLHLDVVELEHVDVVGLEALEALVDREAHERRIGAHAAARSARGARDCAASS